MKKVISLFLSLTMLLSIVSVVDFSAFADVKTGWCGMKVTYSLDTSTGVLTISTTDNMLSQMFGFGPTDSPFYKNPYIKSIIIESCVSSIGSYAFSGCTSLASVTIAGTVTSIGNYAFSGCTSLTSVTIPNSVTSIGSYAFGGCTSLTSVTIPNSVTSIGSYVFSGCTSLTSVTIPNSVKSIGDYAFSDCTSLTSVTIPNSVKSIGDYAFSDCTSLTSVTIPNSVTSIGSNAFYNTAYYNDESNWNNGALYISDCLINIIDDFDSTTDYTIKGGTRIIACSAFGDCTNLTSVTIPDSVKNIGSYAFSDCASLTSITIPDSVTSIGVYAFSDCTSLTSVTIPNSVKSIGSYAFDNCSNLKSVNYNGTKAKWKSISGYSNVSQIIKCTDGIYANSNTIIIDSVKYRLNDDYTAEVISYSGTPGNITILESVAYEGFTFKVTSIGSSAFKNCTSLTSVTIPNSVTSIGSSAFSGCSNLKSVNYNGTKAKWKSISGYSNVSQIIKCTDGIYANSNTIIINSVKYRLNDDYTAQVISYSGTPENITISECVSYEGITFKVTSIGSSAFNNCSSLTSVTIPNSVTSIGSSAFSGCTSLASVTIPNSVTNISCDAFNGCSKLKKIEIPDSVTYIGSKAFDGTAFYNTVKNWEDGVLYCGNHLISAKSDVTKITVKASTVSIAAGALDNCKSLKKINVLNPKCVINCTIPKTAVIGGAEGSTAEDFAQKNNMSIDYFEECTHSDKVQVVIAATCTEQGAVQSRCADCDKLISQTFTAPLGHTMVITTPAKAPTCTTSGNTQAGYCTVCGYNEVSTVIPATGHNFGNNSANCLVCGVANPNYVAPAQPTPNPTPSTAPTQPNQNDTNTSNDEDVTVISKPKSASIKKVKGAKKAILVTWKKVSGVNGYEIQVATDKKFKKNKKTVTIKKQKTTKTTVKKLKAKKKYYVRVRTYKIVNGKKVYSSWSKVESVKTK